MTNSSVGFPQFYQIQQILDRFLGKNGAGKTTLIKILLNLIDKSSGTVVYVLIGHLMYRYIYHASKRSGIDNAY